MYIYILHIYYVCILLHPTCISWELSPGHIDGEMCSTTRPLLLLKLQSLIIPTCLIMLLLKFHVTYLAPYIHTLNNIRARALAALIYILATGRSPCAIPPPGLEPGSLGYDYNVQSLNNPTPPVTWIACPVGA